MRYYVSLPGFPQLGKIEVDIDPIPDAPPVPPVVVPPVVVTPDPPAVEPPPVVTPEPTDAIHPRMLIVAAEIERILANIRNCPDAWQRIIAVAEGSKPTPDRMLCCAALWRLGLAKSFKYRDNINDYGSRAVADLLAWSGPIFGDQDSVACLAYPLVFDWCYRLLTDDQVAACVAKIEAAIRPHDTARNDMAWNCYNQWGGNGMVGAIAIAGHVATDYVTLYRAKNWGAKHKHFLSYSDAGEQFPDGGYYEGFHYLPRCWSNFVVKAAYESATGDRETLNLGIFNQNFRWQLDSIYPLDPYKSGQPFRPLNRYNYGGEPSVSFGHFAELQCSTSYAGTAGKVSRWILDRTRGYDTRTVPPAVALLTAILIGDSRVEAVAPSEFPGLANHVYDNPGEVLWRSGWSHLAALMSFACHRVTQRLLTAGDFMLAYAGKLITGNRDYTHNHAYGEAWYRNHVTFWEGDSLRFFPRNLGPGKQEASFKTTESGYESECSRRYRDARVWFVRRAVDMQRANDYIYSIVDEVKCDPTLTPRIAWNVPLQPEMTDSGFIARNGGVSCSVEITGAAKITVVGGKETMTGPEYGYFNSLKSEDDRIQAGGYFTVMVDMPAGGGVVNTRFEIQ